MLWLAGKDVTQTLELAESLRINGPRRIAYRPNGAMMRFAPAIKPGDVVAHYECMLFTEDEILAIRSCTLENVTVKAQSHHALPVTLISIPCPHATTC
jgi:hypothetical protein